MYRIISSLLIANFFCGFVLSQTPPKFHISYYNTENGLPSNGIKGLQWDEHSGFLWIATEAGISRFNGLDFTNFTLANTAFIASERMLFVKKNNAGRIYAADQSGALFFIKDNKFLLYQRPGIANNETTYDKRFTITVSDSFFTAKTKYKGTQPITLLYDIILPENDTSCFIIHNGRIFHNSISLEDVILYPDTSLIAKAGFNLQHKCFVLDQNFQIHQL